MGALAFNLSAQTITLTGKVTDQSGKAVAGAVVKLLSKNLSGTTTATGTYSITGTPVISAASTLPGAKAVSMKNGSIVINLTKPEAVRVDLFDMRGTLLESTIDNCDLPGIYRFNVAKRPFATTMMVVRVTIGLHASTYRYLPLSGEISAIRTVDNAQKMLAKKLATVDTLQASAAGYKAKKVPISSYNETVDIILESEFTGTCTASKNANKNVSGTGPHKVVVETNADAGIKEGTIYRPEDLGPGKNYPIFIWGEGACSLNGSSNEKAMAEIASHGYFVIADGTPGGGGSRAMDLAQIIKPTRAYVTWAIAENRKPCSAYYQSLDTSKVASNGFSCGGFLGQALAGDPRTTTWGVTSSGSFGAAPDLWNSVHTPVLILEGSLDVQSAGGTGAYTNGLRDFDGIAPLKWPVYFISNKNFKHGGDLGNTNGGEFTKINLAWLNWWLKGDTGATGKGVLVGSTCKYCTDSNWEVKSANIP